MDYGKLMDLGIPGLKLEIDHKLAEHRENPKRVKLYEAMLMALNVMEQVLDIYAERATLLAESEENGARKSEAF